MSIFETPSPGKATRSMPAKGALTGSDKEQVAPPPNHRGSSVRHVPNSDERK